MVVLVTRRAGAGRAGRRRAAVFPVVYLAAAAGAHGGCSRQVGGREALLLALLVVWIVSDTAQFYVGSRSAGTAWRRPSARRRRVEGAIGGLVAGTPRWPSSASGGCRSSSVPVLAAAGRRRWWPSGIAGDLFESLLKRSAGVKDSSA